MDVTVDIPRDPAGAASAPWDVIVVGGGIYGAMILLELARSGARALLLERGEFGGATSSNHFRIVHGGLRYLQSLDLPRFRESVRERRWMMRTFPELVRPLRCVMPLYGRGMKRPAVMRIALAANDLLSADRNRGLPPGLRLPRGRVVSAARTRTWFPALPPEGLRGAAVWYDAEMLHGNRILMEVLRWACALGASAQNHVEVTGVDVEDGRVRGVQGLDLVANEKRRYTAARVVNAAGPWSREVAARADRDRPELFVRSRAWNAVFDLPALGEGALAVTPPYAGARTYFVRSLDGRLYAGTGHAGCAADEPDPRPSAAELEAFVEDLRLALPGLGISRDDVVRVDAGFLPVERAGTADLTGRPAYVDHGRTGGPVGLHSIAGVKYTTARHVAAEVVRPLLSGRNAPASA